MFAATVGIGHGMLCVALVGCCCCCCCCCGIGVDGCPGGRVWFWTTGDAPGVDVARLGIGDSDVEGRMVVLVDATGVELITEAVVVGVDIELTSLCSASLSLRRFTPRDELSFKPSAVALIRI